MRRTEDPLALLVVAPALVVEIQLRIAERIAAALLGVRDEAPSDEDRTERLRRRDTYAAIERNIAAIARNPAGLQELIRAIGALSKQVRPVVLGAIQLTEALVQDASRLYGWSEEAAAYKHLQVRVALLRLLKQYEATLLPTLWPPLRPFVLSYVVDNLIDLVVSFINRSDLWQAPPAEPIAPRGMGILAGLRETLVGWLTRLAWKFTPIDQLDPRYEPLVRSLILDRAELETNLVALAQAFVANRDAINAFLELLIVATHEAERFSELSGLEKRRYVIDVIVDMVRPSGAEDGEDDFANSLLRSAIGFAIDAAILLFNRRGRFARRSEIPGDEITVDALNA